MKQTLFILFLSCALWAQAQVDTLIVDTTGLVACYQKVFTGIQVIVGGDSLTYSQAVSFNANGIPLFIADTTVAFNGANLIDTFAFATPGTYFVGYRVIRCDSGVCDTFFTPLTQIFVDTACIAPVVSYTGSPIPSLSGGVQPLQRNAGYTAATVKVFVSLGDTSFTIPFFAGSFTVNGGATTMNYNFTGYPSGYYISYKFVIENALGSDTTSKKWLQTLVTAAAPWVSNNPTNTTVGQDSVDAFWDMLTNGLSTTVTGQWKLSGAANWTTLSLGTFPGNAGTNAVNFSLSNLAANTTYKMRVYAVNSSGADTSLVYTVTTDPAPIQFSAIIDTSHASSGTTQQITGHLIVPGANANIYWTLTTFNDSNYVNVLQTSTLQSFTGGVWQTTFDALNLTVGGHYRVSLAGVSGATIIPVGDVEYTFVFLGTAPTVDNVVISNITPYTATATVTAMTLAAGTVKVKWGTVSGNYSNPLPTQNIVTGTNNKIFNFASLPYHDTVFVEVIVATTVSGLTDTAWVYFITTDTTATVYPLPIIVQSGATVITDSSAMVEVIVDGAGYATSTVCAWGIVNGIYPNATAPQAGGTGSTTLNFNISNLASNTTYFVRITATGQGGTVIMYFSFTTLPATVGVEEIEKNRVTIFPNPTTDFLYISGYEEGVQLIDVQGKILMEGKNALDVQNIPEGTYFLIFETGQSRKVVVRR